MARSTKNKIPPEVAAQVIAAFNTVLPCLVDAQAQAKMAHWIVAGPAFDGRHATFDEVAGALAGYGDTVAEYIVQLGGTPLGSARDAAKLSALPELPHDAIAGLAVSSALAEALAMLLQVIRSAEGQVNAIDRLAGDVLIEAGRGVQKWLWQVEAVLQAAQ